MITKAEIFEAISATKNLGTACAAAEIFKIIKAKDIRPLTLIWLPKSHIDLYSNCAIFYDDEKITNQEVDWDDLIEMIKKSRIPKKSGISLPLPKNIEKI